MADLPEPISKEDIYLKYIAENCLNGGGGGGGDIPLPVSIENGGTGGITAEEARTNLELYSKTEIDTKLNETVPITRGGTGATDTTNARTNLDVYSKTEVDSKANETVPITRGGTGATNVTGARTNLDIYSKSEVDDIRNNIPESLDVKVISLTTTGVGQSLNLLAPVTNYSMILIMASQYTDKHSQSYLFPPIAKYTTSSFKHRVYVNSTSYLEFHFETTEKIVVDSGTGYITEIYGLK